MTIWDNIYKNYQAGGEEYATLRKSLIPEFLEFMDKHEFKEKSVLDVGCGNGKYLVLLKSLGFAVSGIDSSPTAVEMAKSALGQDADILCADMYEYVPPASRYGLIISIAAIHHGLKKQVKAAVNNIYAALIPGGRFFITLPENEDTAHWTSMVRHEEIEPGTRIPLDGPEKGLPHSSYTRDEVKEMFKSFKNLELTLLPGPGRWIVSGEK